MITFVTILMVLGELISVIIMVIAIVMAFIVWKDNRNPIDLGTLFLFLSAAIAIFNTSIRDSLKNLGLLDPDFYVNIGLLEIGYVSSVLIASLYIWFILYILGWSKLYSLPLVVGFYFGAYGVLTGDLDVVLAFVTYAILPSVVILLYNAIKNKHGLSFTLAIMAIASVLIAVVEPETVWSFVIKWFTGINIILGENGWWDDHVFYDRAKRKKIQNVWIAKMITTDN
ncbi:MAG: hypothetical protein ACTSWX_06950 [Promethearchaeota archaeon]